MCGCGIQSKKGQAIKTLVRREFEKGRRETDPEKIEALKAKSVDAVQWFVVSVVALRLMILS